MQGILDGGWIVRVDCANRNTCGRGGAQERHFDSACVPDMNGQSLGGPQVHLKDDAPNLDVSTTAWPLIAADQ